MKVASERKCGVCGRLYPDHSGARCDYCGRPVEHHNEGDIEAEKAGRRRMAEARQAAGSPLDYIDRLLLQDSAA